MRWLACAMVLWAATADALSPGELLQDPALEERARDLSRGLRCPVCQNESIDESNAPIARDLRLLVRERLVAGDSDAEVVNYVVSRYGEFVLLQPDARGANLLLWIAGPLVALAAIFGVLASLRAGQAPAKPLSTEEERELSRLLHDTETAER